MGKRLRKISGIMAGVIMLLIISPNVNAAMFDQFENGLQEGSTEDGQESSGWSFYTEEGDQGTISIDNSDGANGTSSSLRVDVTEGDMYLYYLVENRGQALEQAAGANRMRFFIKFDENYPEMTQEWPWHQFELGTFMADDSTGLHYYHFFNNKGEDGWQEVILPNNPSLQRDVNGVDAPYIEDYYDRFERFYIDATPELSNMEGANAPYTIWVDEVEFFYEPEQEACTAQGQYEFNGLVCAEGTECTGELIDGCCIQGGCTETASVNSENQNEVEGNVEVEAEIEAGTCDFNDIDNHWAEPDILNLCELGVVQGKQPHVYEPNVNINRAEIVKILTLLFDIDIPNEVTENPCPDVDMDEWYAPYFEAAIDNGIIEGYSDGTCQPARDINRAEAIKVFMEAGGAMDSVPESSDDWLSLFGLDQNPFWDTDANEWYMPYVLVGFDAGVVMGYPDKSYRPSDFMTRAEVAKVAMRSYEDLDDYQFEPHETVPECTQDTDCPENEACENNVCVASGDDVFSAVNYSFDSSFGGMGQGEGQFYKARSVAIDEERGFIYVADSDDDEFDNMGICNNNRIQQFDLNGNFIMQWGGCGNGDTEFNTPQGVAVDDEGFVYVADRDNNRIVKYDSEGNFIDKWGSYGAGESEFDQPRNVTVDDVNNFVYVADSANNRVQKFTKDGVFEASIEQDFDYPTGVSVNSNGRLYVADANNNRVVILDNSGNYLSELSDGFDFSYNVSVDPNGNIWVVDEYNNRVLKYDSDFNKIEELGGFNLPHSVDINTENGYIYIADEGNHEIKVYKPE